MQTGNQSLQGLHPPEALRSIRSSLEDILAFTSTLTTIVNAIGILRNFPSIVTTLTGEAPDFSQHPEIAKQIQTATSESESGNQTVCAQALVTMWSKLEATILDFTASYLMGKRELLQKQEFQKVKFDVAEFSRMSDEEFYWYIVDELYTEAGRQKKQGVDRFEALLRLIDLGGDVDKSITVPVHQMYHIRNVLVHNRGIADRKIIRECGSLRLQIGDKIIVTQERLIQFNDAVADYVMVLIGRLGISVPADGGETSME